MNYSYEQIGMVCATFHCDGGLDAGHVCLMCDNDTVGIADEDSHFDGVVLGIRDQCAAVAVRGFVTVPYTGSAPFCGYNPLAADGNGNVIVAADHYPKYLIVRVDTVNKTVTFLL